MKASHISHRLGLNAQAVCRYYLFNGRRQGRYWTVGDARNTPGRSMFVRLSGPEFGPGAAGRWTDAATAEYGDLLDVIRESCGFIEFRDVANEARRFLRLAPPPLPYQSAEDKTSNRTDLAKRLYAAGRPLPGTLGEAYLNRRGIGLGPGMEALRFHPRAWFSALNHYPAILAAVRDNAGNITGITRLFLDNNANLIERRALGRLNGNAVRIGPIAQDHLLVGEGLESTLSFTTTHPGLALAATLSAAHMAAFNIPKSVRRLTIAADNDPAGRNAAAKLHARAIAQGVAVRVILPKLADFNDDLVADSQLVSYVQPDQGFRQSID